MAIRSSHAHTQPLVYLVAGERPSFRLSSPRGRCQDLDRRKQSLCTDKHTHRPPWYILYVCMCVHELNKKKKTKKSYAHKISRHTWKDEEIQIVVQLLANRLTLAQLEMRLRRETTGLSGTNCCLCVAASSKNKKARYLCCECRRRSRSRLKPGGWVRDNEAQVLH